MAAGTVCPNIQMGRVARWMLRVVLSCPVHGVMLEPGRKVAERNKLVNREGRRSPEACMSVGQSKHGGGSRRLCTAAWWLG